MIAGAYLGGAESETRRRWQELEVVDEARRGRASKRARAVSRQMLTASGLVPRCLLLGYVSAGETAVGKRDDGGGRLNSWMTAATGATATTEDTEMTETAETTLEPTRADLA